MVPHNGRRGSLIIYSVQLINTESRTEHSILTILARTGFHVIEATLTRLRGAHRLFAMRLKSVRYTLYD